MYSLIRSLIGENEARMLIHVSVVVRTTRMSERPSTPTLYWIPNNGIQLIASLDLDLDRHSELAPDLGRKRAIRAAATEKGHHREPGATREPGVGEELPGSGRIVGGQEIGRAPTRD